MHVIVARIVVIPWVATMLPAAQSAPCPQGVWFSLHQSPTRATDIAWYDLNHRVFLFVREPALWSIPASCKEQFCKLRDASFSAESVFRYPGRALCYQGEVSGTLDTAIQGALADAEEFFKWEGGGQAHMNATLTVTEAATFKRRRRMVPKLARASAVARSPQARSRSSSR